MMKKVISINAYQLKMETEIVEVCRMQLQNIVSDLYKGFFITKLTSEVSKTLMGFAIKKERIFDIAEKPEFLQPIVDYANECRIKISGYAGYLEIKGGKVSLTKNALDTLKEKYTSYAEGKVQCERLSKYEAVVNAMNNLNDDLTGSTFFGNRIEALDGRIKFEDGKYKVDPHFIFSIPK
jgi:hypothetical protein